MSQHPASRRQSQRAFSRSMIACAIAQFPLVGLVIGVLAITAPAAAIAQPTSTRSYNIPAGPLDSTLSRWGSEAGILLSFEPSITAGLVSNGLRGGHTPDSALNTLLVGTGLEAIRQTDGSYLLKRTSISASSQNADTLAEVKVVARAERSAQTEGTGLYAATGASVLKGGVLSLKDIPQSVTVITRQQMDDQGLDTLDEVLASTTGVTLVKRPEGGTDFYTRGFMTNTVQYDGIPLLRSTTWGNSLAATSIYLDRVEVLRGAQGLLEGAGNPAGAINVVRKRGLAENTLRIDGRLGSWDNYGTRLEAGGSLDKDGRLRSRVALDYESKGSFIDTISEKNLNAYAALDLDLTPETTIGLGLVQSTVHGNSALYDGIPRYADGSALPVPRSTYIGADWNDAKRREHQVFLDLEHRFNTDWKLKIAGAYVKEAWEATVSNASASASVPVGGSTIPGLGYTYDFSGENLGVDVNLSGRFNALGLKHDVVLGGNYSRQKRSDSLVQYWNHTVYDVFNVNHSVGRFGQITPTYSGTQDSETVQKGIYGMLRSHVTDRLALILGGRASWYDYSAIGRWQYPNQSTVTTPSPMNEKGEFTPYAGLVYSVTPQWSVYGSYADIFQPQTATDAQRNVLKPIVGKNYEVGIKGELLEGALTTSLAIFRIDQQNRSVRDADAPNVCGSTGTSFCSRAAGEVRSQGVDLEAHGRLTRGWQVSAGYTYNRNEFLNDYNTVNIGRPFEYVTPKHLLRVWSDWQLPGEWARWRIGVGVNYRSEQRTSSTTKLNPVQGGFSVWNARLAYQFNKTWSAALNIENLFDKHYYSNISDNYTISYVGTPRNILLTVRGNF